jgi:hypothetical protein
VGGIDLLEPSVLFFQLFKSFKFLPIHSGILGTALVKSSNTKAEYATDLLYASSIIKLL